MIYTEDRLKGPEGRIGWALSRLSFKGVGFFYCWRLDRPKGSLGFIEEARWREGRHENLGIHAGLFYFVFEEPRLHRRGLRSRCGFSPATSGKNDALLLPFADI